MSLRSRLAHFEVMLSLTPWKGRHAAARELTCSHSLYHCNKKWKNSSFNFALIYFVQSCIEKVQNKTNFYLIIFFSKVRSKFIVIWVWSTILGVIRIIIILIIFILIIIRNAQTCNKRKIHLCHCRGRGKVVGKGGLLVEQPLSSQLAIYIRK